MFCLHVCVCVVCMLGTCSVKGIRSPGVLDGDKLPCGWWESNLGPFQEQLSHLTSPNKDLVSKFSKLENSAISIYVGQFISAY